MTSNRTIKRKVMQARGVKRREQLMEAAMELLKEKSLGDISLAEIAEKATIPVGSAYHFYSDVNEIYAGVARHFAKELEKVISLPLSEEEAISWQNILRVILSRVVSFYNQRPDYRQLIIGGKAPAEIKLSDRVHDESLSRMLIDIIGHHFVVPQFDNIVNIFFYSAEIADLMFTLSQISDGFITEEMEHESQVAMISYLRVYLPEILPRVKG